MIDMVVNLTGLMWQSDWNGYEVGFPEVSVVGLYTSPALNCDMYIDMENMCILQIFMNDDEEEC